MGPRSWDRGEFVKLGAIVNRRGGFNGAAVLGPRRADENAQIMLDKLQASMGPRSWDRGEVARRLGCGAFRDASMGPGSWARGEESSASFCSRTMRSFNGAAVLGPRRAAAAAARPSASEPLQWGRGLGTAESWWGKGVQAERLYLLQWGRGLGTAESSIPVDDCLRIVAASMGPRSWDRGEQRLIQLESGVKRASMRPRSWGRREDDYRRRDASAETRFNGAAVLGPRRAHRGAQHSRGHRPASMGPRSWDRGEREAARLSAEAASASMGPRSWDRGERRSLLHRLVVFLTLQWGRGLGTAERAPAIGGRARLDGASMGPRSWDRGESRRRRVPLRARRFDGAAVLGPRRVSVAGARARWSHGFNGAAVLGPRRGWWRRTGFHRASRFNGAAVLGPRRVP